MAERGAEESCMEDEARVGRKDQVREARLWCHQLNGNAKLAKRLVKGVPLLGRALRGAATGTAHPRVDLVLDAVVGRRAHQDTRRRHAWSPGLSFSREPCASAGALW